MERLRAMWQFGVFGSIFVGSIGWVPVLSELLSGDLEGAQNLLPLMAMFMAYGAAGGALIGAANGHTV